jgi:hypothetical protein
MHRLQFFLTLEELAYDPAKNGTKERRKEGKDDRCIEVSGSLVVVAGVGVFDAACGRLYIF